MGKKDFFKFPNKKTLEYILIGILFVAVLSCTMKMMNISFNNILEGFTEYTCPVYQAGETCVEKPSDQQTPVSRPSYMFRTRDFSRFNTITINGVTNPINTASGNDCATSINRNYNSSVHAYHDDSANSLYITQKEDGTEAFGGSAPVFSIQQCQPNGATVTITKVGGGLLPIDGGVAGDTLLVTSCTWGIQLTADFCTNVCTKSSIDQGSPPRERDHFFDMLWNQRGGTVATGDSSTANGVDASNMLPYLLTTGLEDNGGPHRVSEREFRTFLSTDQNGGSNYSYTIVGSGCEERAGTEQPFTADLITDCGTLRTRLELTDGEARDCINNCEESAPGRCGQDATLAETDNGCEIQENEDSDPSCVCGPTALNEPGSFNTLPTSFSGENSCLNSIFKGNDRSPQGGLISADNGELTDRSITEQGWATGDGDGDRCLPRWPCIDTMNDYLNILKKTKDQCTADKTTDNWYDNDNTDNEMKVSYCQPFNQDTDFSECNNFTSKGACEAATDPNSDDKICSWNPYCLPRHRGRNLLVAAGERMDDGAIQCQAHLHPRECNSDSENDCYWDWPLAEEINHNRDDNKKTDKLYNIINPTIAEFDTTNCREEHGSYLDNIKCSAYTAAITASPGNRPYGYCPGDGLCDTDGIHGECLYCSSLSLRSGTPDYPGREYVKEAWEIISTPDPDADNLNDVNSEDCYTLYRN